MVSALAAAATLLTAARVRGSSGSRRPAPSPLAPKRKNGPCSVPAGSGGSVPAQRLGAASLLHLLHFPNQDGGSDGIADSPARCYAAMPLG